MNQSTLHLVGNCFKKEWRRERLIDMMGELGWRLPDAILQDPAYERVSPCTILMREVIFCKSSVHSDRDAHPQNSFSFFLLKLILDVQFREWFVSIYMHEIVNILRDTFTVMTKGDTRESVQEKRKERDKDKERRQRRNREFAQSLAIRQVRREIYAQLHPDVEPSAADLDAIGSAGDGR